jgi:hypothetical protein
MGVKSYESYGWRISDAEMRGIKEEKFFNKMS